MVVKERRKKAGWIGLGRGRGWMGKGDWLQDEDSKYCVEKDSRRVVVVCVGVSRNKLTSSSVQGIRKGMERINW